MSASRLDVSRSASRTATACACRSDLSKTALSPHSQTQAVASLGGCGWPPGLLTSADALGHSDEDSRIDIRGARLHEDTYPT